MSRPSWVEPTAIEGADGHSASGVHLAEGLVPPPLVAHELCAPEAQAPQPSTPRAPSPASGVVRVAAAAEPAGDPYQRHLDDVVRAFFPGWDPRSPRASRPPLPPQGKRG
ncbi:MAG TPA: hypothetical protein VFS43_40095 [Polyangiaceae bacterium]|nr:hypothetical protein [Polyangiaceae bacterium]